MPLVYRSYVACTEIAPLDISSLYIKTFAALDALYSFYIIKYESNIGAVSGYHRVEVATNLEKLVVAVIVSAVFFATAILLVSAVVLFLSIFAAIFVVAVLSVATVSLAVLSSWCSSSPSQLPRSVPNILLRPPTR